MKMALRLAHRGAGFVSPNPMVGAVLVKDGRIISTGYHHRHGGSHAEVQAIEGASESVKGAVLYCNLEPCCHLDKQTPPCAQRLIREGIKKAVISDLDPNPKVHGKGVKLLRTAGIEVVTGLLKTENSELNRFYNKYTCTNRPYVTIKIAQTLDGKIARQKGKQSWISSAGSRKMVHRLRTEYDAVLVGGNTVRIDNPELTRHGVKGRNPVRIIVDGKLRLNPGFKIFENATQERVIVLAGNNRLNFSKKKSLESTGCKVILLPADRQGRINLDHILDFLAGEKITSLLVEGGQQIFSQFLENDWTDELAFVIAPQIWGGGIPAIKRGKNFYTQNWRLHEKKNISGDLLLIYRRS
jgi:diaminohydroxyphosphoribosylaminopyrimidine deaminase/5-amino-6-(5-phosphoribosylamino)uracil reductase